MARLTDFHRQHPLRISTSSSINPKPGTTSLGHVRGYSASACAMLCDHSRPTPAMHTMPAQLRPHAPVKPRESALIPIVTTRPPEAGPAYTWQLSRTPRISSQTNKCLSCALCPHSCAPGKDFPVSQARLTLELFCDGLPKKKLQLVGMTILINPIKPWAGMSHKGECCRH
jgi:hypothetical protein